MITAQQYIYNSKKEKSFVTSQKHTQTSSNGKKVGKEGDVYILLRIYSEKEFVPNRFSRFVLDSILDGYLYSNSKSTNESVKDAVEDGVKKIKDLIKNDKDLSTTGIDVSFLIVVFKKEGAYVGVFGENEVYLYKKNSIVNIGEIIMQKKANTAGIVLKESDVLVISTKNKVTENLTKISRLRTSEDIIKFLRILGENLNTPSGLMYFAMKEEEAKVVEPIKVEEEVVQPKILELNRVKQADQIIKKSTVDIKKFTSKIKIPSVHFGRLKPLLFKVSGPFSKVFSFLAKKVDSLKEIILNKLRNKRWFKKIGSKFSEIKITNNQPRREGFRVDGYKLKDVRNKRFKIIFVTIIIILLIALGVNFTITKKKERETSRYANDRFVQVTEYLNEVERDWRTDRAGAETNLFKTEKLFEEIPTDINEEDKDKYDELRKRYLSLGDVIYRRVGVSEEAGNISKFLESRLAFGEGSTPTDIDIYTDNSANEFLVVSDKDRNAVHRVSIYDKGVKTLPDEDKALIDPLYVSVGKNGVYVYDGKVGMLQASFGKGGEFKNFTPLSGLSSEDINAKDIVEMIVLTDSDNVYLLARDSKAVLKSTPAYGDRYGLSYPYLEKEEFSQANDIFSDLSVYVTSSLDPELVRYNYSAAAQKLMEAPLSVGGFDGNYGNLTKGFTREDMSKGLFIFDSEQKRVFKFEKPLEGGGDILHPDQIVLLNQYMYRGSSEDVWNNVKDIVVDDKEENMYILDGSVIWKVSL
ncbi:MAG: hypothetical protein AB9915_01890 [Candidatus Dojkabacteria bacterium]